MEDELQKLVDSWQRGYDRLAELSMEQYVLVKNEADEETRWEPIARLAGEKDRLQNEMEQIQKRLIQELGLERVQRIFEERIHTPAESARLLTAETTRKIEMKMLSVGKDLGSTRTQRTVLQAYQGISAEDHMSHYFDEKK